MNNTHMVAVGIRLFCIWLAIDLLSCLPNLWWMTHTDDEWLNTQIITVIAATIAFTLLVLILLWLFPVSAAHRILPKSTHEQSTSLLPGRELMQVGCCLLGLWLLTEALPSAVGEAIYMSLPPRSKQIPIRWDVVAEIVVEILLAVWLILGARGLRRVLDWVSTAGSGPRYTQTDDCSDTHANEPPTTDDQHMVGRSRTTDFTE